MLRSFDPVLRNVPVVVISGNMQSGAALEGIEAYLRKPVKIDSLINIIGQHCRTYSNADILGQRRARKAVVSGALPTYPRSTSPTRLPMNT
jgi:hypothetical protein